MTPHELTLFIYNISLFPVIFFSVLFIILTVINLAMKKEEEIIHDKTGIIPFVSVQIPTFNDPVAERCVRHCMRFDYPKDKYEIIIADDSTNNETQQILKKLAGENPGFVKYIHRNNRENFKPGALKNAMSAAKGDLIVIFDADWMPQEDFLKRIIAPFSDPNVGIVQARQGVYNKDTNLITRFAAYLLMIYHEIAMPINNKINCVFFCGTAGAIRRSAFEEAGGWNVESITEDADLSVKLLLNGYKSVYLEMETPSEVPDTFEGFVKQQMRWCYGNARVFFDNASGILFKNGITMRQRLMIIFITLGNVLAPFVVIMTFAGLAGWFIGEPELFSISDITEFAVRLFYTIGFILMGIITLHKKHRLYEVPHLFLTAFTLGIVLAMANTVAFFRAIFNKKLSWFCTPKAANDNFV